MSLHPTTHHTYSSHLNSYLTFCDIHHFPMAPPPDTFSFYIVFMSHYIQPHSVDNYLSGLVLPLKPHFPEAHEVCNSSLVCHTLHGSLHHFSHLVSCHQPLSHADLLHALSSCPCPFSFDDLGWLAMLLCGFFSLLCLGELVHFKPPLMLWPDSLELHEYSCLSPWSSVELSNSSFAFTVPCHKSDTCFEGHSIHITHSHLLDDPYSVFTQYLAFHDALFPLHPWLWVRTDGTIPTHAWFLSCFHAVFPDPSFWGHSLWSRGATSLTSAGVPPLQIQAIGGWSSSVWQHYVHKHPVLLQTLLFHDQPIHNPPFSLS
ncbi:hypothetical protein BKA83DRAFT_4057785 [Pisolithus microcarpus]|nr:hypothetical protein BKA83DRAFT_4057785 [Pisolithus microcarpus]